MLTYNNIAAKVMSKQDVVTDDLYEAMQDRLPSYRCPPTFTSTLQGYAYLARQVARSIEAELGRRQIQRSAK